MDKRLFLAVLFGTLSWISVAGANNATTTPAPTMTAQMTSAGNNMTSAPTATQMTSVGNNMTSGPTATQMTTAGNNMTSGPTATQMTSVGNNMTSGPTATQMTTEGNNMTSGPTATQMTTAGNNMTTGPTATQMTTAGSNMTTGPTATQMTTAGSNMTTGPTATMATQMTTAGNNTTAAPTTAITAAPPLETNTTVETLETTISNTGCGTEQLCAAEPSSCDPARPGSCFFLAAKQQSGQNFEFGLAGESDGYVAASLSTDDTLGGNDTTYICANDNGTVKFFGALLDNGQLKKKELNVNSVKGKVDGKKIQCTFAATVPDPVARTTGFSLAISTGPYDSSSGDLGAPSTQLKSPVVNLANPSTTVTNEISANTNVTDSGYSFTLKQPLTQTLLISAGVLGLAML